MFLVGKRHFTSCKNIGIGKSVLHNFPQITYFIMRPVPKFPKHINVYVEKFITNLWISMIFYEFWHWLTKIDLSKAVWLIDKRPP